MSQAMLLWPGAQPAGRHSRTSRGLGSWQRGRGHTSPLSPASPRPQSVNRGPRLSVNRALPPPSLTSSFPSAGPASFWAGSVSLHLLCDMG